jgi:hypothetical protein
MKSIFMFAISLLILAPAFAGPSNSCGFITNKGKRVSWNSRLPIRIYFDPSFPVEFRDAVIKAGQVLESPVHRKLFDFAGELPSSHFGKDGYNVIYLLDESQWNIAGLQSNIQALATVQWDDNQISEADIRVNGGNFEYATNGASYAIDVESLFIQQLGHVLGLNNLNFKKSDKEDTVMTQFLGNGVLRRILYSRDEANLRCGY